MSHITDKMIETAAKAIFFRDTHVDEEHIDEIWALLPEPEPDGDEDNPTTTWPEEVQYILYITDHGKSHYRSLSKACLEAALASAPEPQDIPDFKPCVIVYPEGGISEMLLEDCPTIVGQEMMVRPILRMGKDGVGGADVIGFQWPTAAVPEPQDGWRDISTAPTDGSRILAWAKEWSAPSTAQHYGYRGWALDADLPPFLYQPTMWKPVPGGPVIVAQQEGEQK